MSTSIRRSPSSSPEVTPPCARSEARLTWQCSLTVSSLMVYKCSLSTLVASSPWPGRSFLLEPPVIGRQVNGAGDGSFPTLQRRGGLDHLTAAANRPPLSSGLGLVFGVIFRALLNPPALFVGRGSGKLPAPPSSGSSPPPPLHPRPPPRVLKRGRRGQARGENATSVHGNTATPEQQQSGKRARKAGQRQSRFWSILRARPPRSCVLFY